MVQIGITGFKRQADGHDLQLLASECLGVQLQERWRLNSQITAVLFLDLFQANNSLSSFFGLLLVQQKNAFVVISICLFYGLTLHPSHIQEYFMIQTGEMVPFF